MYPHFFIGTWKVLGQTATSTKRSVKEASINYSQSTDTYCLVEHRVDGSEKTWNDLKYDYKNGTLYRKKGEKIQLSIASWHNRCEDVIAALRENESSVRNLWCAKRDLTSGMLHPSPRDGAQRKWQVAADEGNGPPPPPGLVTLAELSASVNGSDEKLKLYGIFYHVSKKGPGKLYDILRFDVRDLSFESIFGVRSIKYRQSEDRSPQADRLFATFDNRSSLPETHLGEHTIGQLLPFEKKLIRRSLSSETPIAGNIGDPPEDGDPNVGVWVGEPTEPEPKLPKP